MSTLYESVKESTSDFHSWRGFWHQNIIQAFFRQSLITTLRNYQTNLKNSIDVYRRVGFLLSYFLVICDIWENEFCDNKNKWIEIDIQIMKCLHSILMCSRLLKRLKAVQWKSAEAACLFCTRYAFPLHISLLILTLSLSQSSFIHLKVYIICFRLKLILF